MNSYFDLLLVILVVLYVLVFVFTLFSTWTYLVTKHTLKPTHWFVHVGSLIIAFVLSLGWPFFIPRLWRRVRDEAKSNR